MKYVFHPAARSEYLEAVTFYEARRPGLGASFTREIESVIKNILEAPDRWRLFEPGVRRCVARLFPYSILYAVESDSILVLAVMHGSRAPGYWRDRLPPSRPE